MLLRYNKDVPEWGYHFFGSHKIAQYSQVV
jgi:hypothetical protein